MKIHQIDINSYVYKRSKDIDKNFEWVFLYLVCAYIHLCFHVTKKMNMHPKIWQYMLPMEANEI